MTWDVTTAKARLGLEGTEQDALVQSAMDLAVAVAEGYCDRRFLKKADTQEFTTPCGPTLLVRRYPLVSLESLGPLDPQDDPAPDPSPVPEQWRMDKKRGIVFMVGAPPYIAPDGTARAPSWLAMSLGVRAGFALNYIGGYDPLPADLEAALWMVFDAAWFSTPGWGADPGSQSGAGGDGVKAFGIDGMTLSFDTGSGDKASGQAGGDVGSWGPLLPLGATALLQFYRAETVMGIG